MRRHDDETARKPRTVTIDEVRESRLDGFTVGITADRRADEQAALFARHGAGVMHGPTIRTFPLGSEEPLYLATTAVIARPPDVLIANTGLGVRSWFGAADAWDLGDSLADALTDSFIVARGPKASGAVHSLGLTVNATGATERLSGAVDMAIEHLGPGCTVAVQVDGTGTSPELERLRATGAAVVIVPVYEWRLPEDTQPAVKLARSVIGGRVHAVTFTTGAAVTSWLGIADEYDLTDALLSVLSGGGCVVGCVGPICREMAIDAGVASDSIVMPRTSRLGPLVRVVTSALADRRVDVPLASGGLTLTGVMAMIDHIPVELSDIEARLLTALARRAGDVISKRDLLTEVWGESESDEHLVEVAVARLRKRLGAHAGAIASVHRRGYVLRAAPFDRDEARL